MLNDTEREYLNKLVLTMRVIVAALASGVVLFFFIVLALRGDQAPGQPLIAYLAAGVGVTAFAASVVVPQVMTAPARQSIAAGDAPNGAAVSKEVGDVGRLGALYQTRVIVAGALLEGAAFFNTIAYLFEGQMLTVVVTIALILSIVGQFPTVGRVENWVVSQMEIIEQSRSRLQ
jgi:hypothetical protein